MKRAHHIQRLTLRLCLLLPVSVLAASGAGDNSGEIWIDGLDTVQPGAQPANPDADVDYRDHSIFVWDGTPATTRKEVFLRIFDENNIPMGDPVQVNTFIEKAQHHPRVAINGDNSFLVVWQSDEPPTPDATFQREVVRSQAFDADGNPVGDEQLLSTLNPQLATGHNGASVAALSNGQYIVTWRSSVTPEPDDNSISIQGRRIGADGVPLAGQFQVNSTKTSASEHYPAVTALVDGGFLVVWTVPQVHGRRFTANGTPVGEDFQINTLEAGAETETDVITHEDGRVLVIWKDEEESGDNSWEIRGRLYSPNLVAQGADFRINSLISGAQVNPRAANYGENGFFVVWESAVSAGNDIEPQSIEGRIVTGSDQFAGSQFLVNQLTGSAQQFPAIGGRNGLIAVAWDNQKHPDTNSSTIQGQTWSICGIFCDSFE